MIPPAISNAGSVMPNILEDVFAHHGEGTEGDKGSGGGFGCHAAAACGGGSIGDGKKGGESGEGINQKKNGAEGKEREPDVGGVLQF